MGAVSKQFLAVWEITSTADFLHKRKLSVIALQFPDELLKDATVVAAALAEECQSRGHGVQACRPSPSDTEMLIAGAPCLSLTGLPLYRLSSWQTPHTTALAWMKWQLNMSMHSVW